MQNRSILFLIGSYLLVATTARAISPGATSYNVKDYGAKGDGVALDSKAINTTIDAAAKAGGGTVFLPAGNYLSGSIHLKSNISLYLDQGAVIIATPSEANGEYDPAEETVNTAYQDYGHSHFHNSLIWGEDIHDVSILGPGTIWGKGLLRDRKMIANLEISR